MATVYSAPIDPPVIEDDDWKIPVVDGKPRHELSPWRIKTDKYIAELAEQAQQNGTDPLLGETISFPVADGYAQYMIWNTKPLQLIHLEVGDAWQAHPILLRGLRISDVREQVAADKRLKELFGSR